MPPMISTPMNWALGTVMLTRRRISVKGQRLTLLHRPVRAILLIALQAPLREGRGRSHGKAGGGKQDQKTHTLKTRLDSVTWQA